MSAAGAPSSMWGMILGWMADNSDWSDVSAAWSPSDNLVSDVDAASEAQTRSVVSPVVGRVWRQVVFGQDVADGGLDLLDPRRGGLQHHPVATDRHHYALDDVLLGRPLGVRRFRL